MNLSHGRDEIPYQLNYVSVQVLRKFIAFLGTCNANECSLATRMLLLKQKLKVVTAIIMDGSPEYGGENRGPRPMELILTGLGGCASFDIVTILKKARQDITDVRCELKAERADTISCSFYQNSSTFCCHW